MPAGLIDQPEAVDDARSRESAGKATGIDRKSVVPVNKDGQELHKE